MTRPESSLPLYCFCFADGMADCMPNVQEYRSCGDIESLIAAVDDACESFDDSCDSAPYKHSLPDCALNALRSAGDASTLNWRLRITRGDEDRVLDVIGMTSDEYETQCYGDEL